MFSFFLFYRLVPWKVVLKIPFWSNSVNVLWIMYVKYVLLLNWSQDSNVYTMMTKWRYSNPVFLKYSWFDWLVYLIVRWVTHFWWFLYKYISILVMITNFKMWYNDSKECACLAGIWNSFFFSFFQIFLTNVNMLR